MRPLITLQLDYVETSADELEGAGEFLRPVWLASSSLSRPRRVARINPAACLNNSSHMNRRGRQRGRPACPVIQTSGA